MLSASSIKQRAAELGFAACGLAKAAPVSPEAASHYDQWLAQECHAEMHYMEAHRDLRLDPTLLHPGTKTVISFALPYHHDVTAPLADYALGADYHDVLRTLLQRVGVEGRICVDTAPILEKYWAVQAGLGWIGRHHQLVIPRQGSAFFLGEILSTEEADRYDTPCEASCGSCRRCVEACPTAALRTDGMLDARRCLSYLTIEHRGDDIPLPPPNDGTCYIYGCDRCLRACPHFAGTPTGTHFPVRQELLDMKPEDWRTLTEEEYRTLFRGSAVKRAKYSGLMRNIVWSGI